MNNVPRHAGKGAFSVLAAAILAIVAGVESKSSVLTTCASEKYTFTPNVRRAFLAYARSQALADLKAQGKSLPSDFFAWIDANPEIEAGVYVAHDKASDVLLQLYSLRLDLGTARFEKYHELALAAAIVHAKQKADADITQRTPLKLVINGDPRKLVNTKEPGQKRTWIQGLSKIITGRESFKPQTTEVNPEALRDPCADAVKETLTET